MATLTSPNTTISCRLFSSVFSLYSSSLSIYKTFCLFIFIPKDSEDHRTTYKVTLRKYSWFTDAGLGFSKMLTILMLILFTLLSKSPRQKCCCINQMPVIFSESFCLVWHANSWATLTYVDSSNPDLEEYITDREIKHWQRKPILKINVFECRQRCIEVRGFKCEHCL